MYTCDFVVRAHLAPSSIMHVTDVFVVSKNKRQNPNHEGNNTLHLQKRQELELQMWKVVSGAL